MPSKKKVAKKAAFRFPKTFTATVTSALFATAAKRKATNKKWNVFKDCPLALAVRRALKIKPEYVETTRVDLGLWSTRWKLRRYEHDGQSVVEAFDNNLKFTLPHTVTFKQIPDSRWS